MSILINFNKKKASQLRLSHKDSKKVQLYSLVLILMIGAFCTWKVIEYKSIYGDEVIRLPSLGQPKPLQEMKSEQNVLLNDPAIRKNWGLLGTGGLSDINVDKAWKISQGSKDVVVAVIDTGIDVNHPDLKNNLWVNPNPNTSKENRIATSFINNDECFNDLHGCNLITGTGDLTDNHGHGTHIAGIIGAEGGNGIGTSGVSPKVSLMVLKYYDPLSSGNDNLKNTVRAIHYAIDHGAQIINYSGGGLDFSQPEYEAIKRARDHGILFIAAAGNEKSNSDQDHYYPANYNLDNIISVTAINPQANVLNSSNYGVNTVHIAAPGSDIYSTLPNGRYGTMTGTSQATAFVTGVAALLKANNPEMGYLQIKEQILGTADTRMNMLTKTQTAGILNSWAALAIQPNIPVSGLMLAQQNSTTTVNNTTVQVVSNSERVPALSQQLSQINNLLKNMADRNSKNLN